MPAGTMELKADRKRVTKGLATTAWFCTPDLFRVLFTSPGVYAWEKGGVNDSLFDEPPSGGDG